MSKMSKSLYQNAKKPEGAGGVFMMNRMNERHRHLAKWGFSKLELKKEDIALDVGCGGGANLATMIQKISEGKVFGVDYSDVSVEISKKKNKKAITTGKCEVLLGDVMDLPFENDKFSVVTAFETVYFWPDIEKGVSEVFRVLKDGGKFMICNEANGLDEKDKQMEKIIDGMQVYQKEELEEILKKCHFKNIQIHEYKEKGWLVLIAEK